MKSFFEKLKKPVFGAFLVRSVLLTQNLNSPREKLTSPVLRVYRPLTSYKNEKKIINQYREML